MKQAYTSRDVAQIVGISESRVRYWAQTGVVGPSDRANGRAVYTFQDLVGVRAAKELLDGGVTLQRARKNLDALRAQLGVDRPLSKLRVRSDGESLIVSDGETTFEPTTGQLVLDFTLDDLSGQLAAFSAPVAPAPTANNRAESAWAWFVEGGDCEARGEDDRALIAYGKALEGDPALAAAHTNVGNLLYRRGERGEARGHYDKALALDPEQPEARYNLANLLDDVGDGGGARMEWYRVVTACPEFADAHYNLALACARDGDAAAARFHLSRYLALCPDDARATDLMARL
ncbi:MAG: transcriptional regulator, MerR family [Myxococcales bacterium]|nr:transcriptional regulator, MerR family [Myxococcales bacterium]